jgi:hypothetical protein
LIEEVKTVFIRDTERLKADLNLLTNVQFSLINEERNAIIDFNEKYFIWLNKISSPSLEVYHIYSTSGTELFRKEIQNRENDVQNSHAKFRLFVEDKDLFIYANNMLSATIRIASKMYNYIEQTKGINLKLETSLKLEEDFRLKEDLRHKNLKPNKQRKFELKLERDMGKISLKWHKKFLKERSLIHKNFIDSIKNENDIVLKMTLTFHVMCREYLYSLIKQNRQI